MELKAQVAAYATVFEFSALIVFVGAIGALWIKSHSYIDPNNKGSVREPVVVLD
jgi:hypothetical protein